MVLIPLIMTSTILITNVQNIDFEKMKGVQAITYQIKSLKNV